MTDPGTATVTQVGELSKRVDFGFEQNDRRFDRVDGDIRELRGDIRELRGDIRELRGEIRELRGEMKHGFEALDVKFDAKFDRLNRTIVYLLGGSLSVLTAGLLAAGVHALF